MQLINLTLQGFKSFDAEATINFNENEPGLYFLTGQNAMEPQLGANGAGKSTILDALVWCLFEMTARRLKAKNIKNWNGDHPVKVSCTFGSRFDRKIHLVRTWSPNSLKWSIDDGESVTVTQHEVEDEIGMTYDMFLSSIMVPQFSTMFFDEKSTAQAQRFTDILQLDEWIKYSEKAKVLSGHSQDLLHDVEETIATAKGQVLTCSQLNFEADIEKWDTSQKVKIREAMTSVPTHRHSIKELTENSDKLEKDLGKQESIVAAIVKEINEATPDLKEIDLDISKCAPEINAAHDAAVGIQSEIDLAGRQLKHFNSLQGKCSRCGQEIDEKHIESEVDAINTKLVALDARKKEQLKKEAAGKKKQENFRKESKEIKDSITEAETEAKRINEIARSLRDARRSISTDIANAEGEIRRCTERKGELQAEVNPFIARKKSNDENLKILKKQVKDDEKTAAGLRKQVQEFTYWTKHFKEVRLFLISEALTQLEIEVNNNLDKLGLHDWSITFDVESAKSDGTLKKGFNVFVQSPANEDPVPWEAWSGGETQRLRIAGITGLTNLILNRKGIDTNIEFWDEPTNGINPEGVTDLVATLRDHAREVGRQVWIVDHRSLSHGAFEKIVNVIKDTDGSRIEIETIDA